MRNTLSEKGAVPEAGNLPAIGIDTLPGIEELYVGRRIPLHHSWDLSSEETVAQVLREELQRYTQHDKTLDKFSENLSEAIQRLTTQGSPFRSLAERIGEELYERFITER